MARLTERQKRLCKEHGYIVSKWGVVRSMWDEGLLNDLCTPRYSGLLSMLECINHKYTLKDLDQMLDYKQLKVQDYCEMKEYK